MAHRAAAIIIKVITLILFRPSSLSPPVASLDETSLTARRPRYPPKSKVSVTLSPRFPASSIAEADVDSGTAPEGETAGSAGVSAAEEKKMPSMVPVSLSMT